MPQKEQQIAQRFAALDETARRGFLDKLAQAGLNFAELPIVACDRSRRLPLSYAQRGLWLTWALDPDSAAYNMPGVLHFHGELDETAWRDSLTDLIQRHETLRTVFVTADDGEPEQKILPNPVLPMTLIDLRDEPPTQRLEQARVHAQALAALPFRLDMEVPFRATLIRLDDDHHMAVLVAHHIAADGWSVRILVEELAQLYNARVLGNASALAPLPIQFADHAVWQRNWLEAGELVRQLDYWRDRLGTEQPVLQLPTDRPRTAATGRPGASHAFAWPAELSDRLRRLARAQDASLYMAMLALFNVVLYRFTGQDDVRIGAPAANRQRIETRGLIGYLTNLQVVRCRLDPRAGFDALLKQVRHAVLDAQSHQDLPFDALVDALQNERQPGVHPLFQVKCTEHAETGAPPDFAGLRVEFDTLPAGPAHFELSLDFTDSASGILLAFTYDPGLFDESRVECLAAALTCVAEQVTEAPQRVLAGLALSDEPIGLHGPALPSADVDVIDAWTHAVACHPERVAIRHEDQVYSYAELDLRAESLARTLRAYGVGCDVRVALHAKRSCEFVLGVLATLKAGGAYVPLDPQWPVDRLAHVCRDSGASVLLSMEQPEWARGLPVVALAFVEQIPFHIGGLMSSLPRRSAPSPLQGEGWDGDARSRGSEAKDMTAISRTHYPHPKPGAPNPPPARERESLALADSWGKLNLPAREESNSHPEQAAYLIYTSGSTGQPKAVVITRRALANYVQGLLTTLALPEDAISMAMVSTVAADLGHTSLFGALCSGRTLHLIAAERAFDPDRFAQYMCEHAVDVLKIVPSHLRALMEATHAADVLPRHTLVVGGEASTWPLLERIQGLRPECRVVNHYGPTETTVGVLTQAADHASRQSATLPLGLPLPRVQAFVLDTELNPVPHGVIGELYVGGPELARGYHRRPGLTAERFVAHPWLHGERLYRTGDRVRQIADGSLEFLGRADEQAKIRGYRVELGEVRAALLSYPNVREAAVIVSDSEDGRAQLLAYVCPASSGIALNGADIKTYIGQRLPDYMVPGAISILQALPLTANGKLDRRALPKPQAVSGYEAPQGEIEQALAKIWAEVLKVERVGRRDNFFDLGGDSILSLQIAARSRRIGLKYTPKQLFDRQNVAELAAVVQRAEPPAAVPAISTRGRLADYLDAAAIELLAIAEHDIEDVYPLAPTQEGMLFHTLESVGTGLYVNQISVPVEGLDTDRMAVAWQAMVARHPILRTAFLWHAGLTRPLQLVRRQVDAAVTQLDWRRFDDIDSKLADYAQVELRREFDLLAPPLSRLCLIHLPGDRHQLIWTQHHVLLDGWGDALLIGDLLRSYAGETLPPPNPPYGDYVRWLGRQDAKATEAFWKQELRRIEEPTLLAAAQRSFTPSPTSVGEGGGEGKLRLNQENPSISSQLFSSSSADVEANATHPTYGKIYTRLEPHQTQNLLAFAKRERVTVNTVIQAAWALLLQRYLGKETIVFGATVAGRPANLSGAQDMLGLFINTIPVPVERCPGLTVADYLRAVQDTNLRLREHEHAALADIQKWAGSAGRSLFDSIIVFENYPVDQALQASERYGLRFGSTRSEGLTGYVMDLQVVIGEQMQIEYCYARRDIGDDFAAELRQHMEHVLDRMMSDPKCRVGELAWLDEQHCAQLLALGCSVTPAASEPWQAVHRTIEAHAASRPDAIALLMGDAELSYAALNAAANRLAHRLVRMGIRPEQRVGVAMERSLDLIVALLAILKAGAAYLPLDPAYPAERLAFMADNGGVTLLLTQQAVRSRLSAIGDVPLLSLDEIDLHAEPDNNPAVAIDGANLAYVIYTSGSTGMPKGVAVAHGPLAMHCHATADIYGMGLHSCELLFMSFSFDGAHERWLTALTSGAGLAVRGDDLWTSEQTYDALHRYRITNAAFPPAYLGQMADWASTRSDPPPVELYVFGGEAMPKAAYDKVRATLQPQLLINGYGPTETVVTPLIWKAAGNQSFDCTYAPIGRPVGERSAYVLDAGMQLVAPGAIGELYIGGYGLARGYLGRAGLTAERFVADPFDKNGGRLYRTGDLVRWMEDGNIEYISRADHQVKIRGFRIELGEIEARLREAPEVEDAAVVVCEGTAGRQLVAYVVPKAVPNALPDSSLDSAPTISSDRAAALSKRLKQRLAKQLPDYMVPSHILALPVLPRLISGKLDTAALPLLGAAGGKTHVAPSTPEARQLAAVWAEVLGIERVGETDNFFELGGDSLSSLKVMAKLRSLRNPGLDFKLRDLLQRPTIAALLGLSGQPAAPLPALNAVIDAVPPLFCLHAGMGTVFDYQPLARRLQGQRTVYGIACRMLTDFAHRDISLARMAEDYCRMIRQTQAEGPYYLLGWSLGGTLAAMIAALLEKEEQQVAFLGLIDSFVPVADQDVDVDWREDFLEFLPVVLPGVERGDIARRLQDFSDKDPAVVAELLDSVLGRDAGRANYYAGMDTQELARVFCVTRHLRVLAQQAEPLTAVQVRPACWWVAERPEQDCIVLAEQLGQVLLHSIRVPARHFTIIRNERVLDEVLTELEVSEVLLD